MKRSAHISDFLSPLSQKPVQAYISNAVQVADILEWILAQVGASEVWQTTFSVSEEYLRRLHFIKKKGDVQSISVLLDYKATHKTMKLWNFMANVVERVYLADNHSKILLVKSKNGDTVSVITSQNLTRGNRHESAFVTTDPQIFATLHEQLEDIIHNSSVSLNDILDRHTGED